MKVASPIEEARAALLRALDQLDKAVDELGGAPERVDLVVVYSVGRDEDSADDEAGWAEVSGWSSTGGPKWVHAALLRRAADAQDVAARAVDDEDET